MKSLNRRLRKLERAVTDASGLVPHTREWLDYWFRVLDETTSPDYAGPPRPAPFEVLHPYFMAGSEDPPDDEHSELIGEVANENQEQACTSGDAPARR